MREPCVTLANCRHFAPSSGVAQPYQSLEAELHDPFWEAEDDASEVALMADFLKRFPGRALEIGAGSGRLLLPLLEMGFAIEGLELSGDMIALGGRRASVTTLKPVIHQGDMSDWNGGKFSALLAPAFTLQLASDPVATLRHWHGMLEDRGGLYLTLFIPYAELLGDVPENEWYPDHEVTLPDGRTGTLETRHSLDPARQVIEREHRYFLSGNPPETHVSRQSLHWFAHHQIMALLAAAGFRVERYFLDFDSSFAPIDPDAVDFDGILTFHAIWKG